MSLSFWDQLSDDVERGRFRAAKDNVLVRIDGDQGDLRPDSLIVAPSTLKRDAARGLLGTVLAVGPGHRPELRTLPGRPKNRGEWDTSPTVLGPFIPTEVRPGDRVVLESQLAGEAWPLRGGECRLVRESEILAVVEREAAA